MRLAAKVFVILLCGIPSVWFVLWVLAGLLETAMQVNNGSRKYQVGRDAK